MSARIARLGVGIHDVEAMTLFYGEILGLSLRRHDLGFVLETEGAGVGFFRVSGPPAPKRSLTHFMENAAGFDHLVLAVPDLHVMLDRLQAHGVAVDVDDPFATADDRTAGRLTLIRFIDPERNLIGLTSA